MVFPKLLNVNHDICNWWHVLYCTMYICTSACVEHLLYNWFRSRFITTITAMNGVNGVNGKYFAENLYRIFYRTLSRTFMKMLRIHLFARSISFAYWLRSSTRSDCNQITTYSIWNDGAGTRQHITRCTYSCGVNKRDECQSRSNGFWMSRAFVMLLLPFIWSRVDPIEK